jgi:hypothetical protein
MATGFQDRPGPVQRNAKTPPKINPSERPLMTKFLVLAVASLSLLAAATVAQAQSTKCKAGTSLVNGKCVSSTRGS